MNAVASSKVKLFYEKYLRLIAFIEEDRGISVCLVDKRQEKRKNP